MRYPFLHKVSRQVNTEEGKLVGTAAIQRHVDDKLRFYVFFRLQRYKQIPLDVGPPEVGKYRGMDVITKLARLHECDVETGMHPATRRVTIAALDRGSQTVLVRQRTASFLRVSTGVYKFMESEYRRRRDHDVEVTDSLLSALKPHWKAQADMATKFIKGEIDVLTNYPVLLRMLPMNRA